MVRCMSGIFRLRRHPICCKMIASHIDSNASVYQKSEQVY
jgi:hypothetical protein